MSNFWRLNLRSQSLAQDEGGHAIWQVQTSAQEWAADQTALLLCDVWNSHWCRGAVERLDAMVERMDSVVQAVRAAGGLIVHAPSDTMDFYADAPARQRALGGGRTRARPRPTRLGIGSIRGLGSTKSGILFRIRGRRCIVTCSTKGLRIC